MEQKITILSPKEKESLADAIFTLLENHAVKNVSEYKAIHHLFQFSDISMAEINTQYLTCSDLYELIQDGYVELAPDLRFRETEHQHFKNYY